MKKIIVNILCVFIPNTTLRHKIRAYFSKESGVYFSFKNYYNTGKNNKIFVIKDGKRKQLSKFQRIRNLKIFFAGDNNEIEIEYPFKFIKESFFGVRCGGNGNKFSIGSGFEGHLIVTLYTSDVYFKMGKHCAVGNLTVNMSNGSVDIGDNCLISSKVLIHDDGHSVIDYKTGELLNGKKSVVKIGNHCWLGFHTSYLKGTDIYDDCIVALGSVVTKKFDTPHCVIAGNPAKIVKDGISWRSISPVSYTEDHF